MPTSIVESAWQKDGTIIDHWRALLNEEVASVFHKGHRDQLHELMQEGGQYYCTAKHHNCTVDGMLRNYNKCHGSSHSHSKCALLLSGYPSESQCMLSSLQHISV